ncbi:MAG TPA: cyclic nucleotide-binding domain-containing protein [Acidobacteriota bacterium]|nr:cyclic nucleotide-binding domain-containing protein [Acidobacteriota bacterium]HNT18726.1 cyclic nucleotide-binding domain-containing protein [Acidobacteriota bacterium]HPA27802.1 cyclic nucleotide-binding domain-containing protein [Acidobacteriota bacterium]HQO21071.1 cyclic nucleotide-binding domain-containing protein [Acidobacteriota bacterium]HQQ47869.1 cyclic nucleotide-binding domain-containing protein [Acidobacteriota bacterium]
MEKIEILKQMVLFHDLDSLELIQLSKLVTHKKYEKGDMVLAEGDMGDSLFVVKNGQFRAFVIRNGVEQQLATFNVGDSFGEMSLIDKQPRSASISALSDGELLEFTKESFETIMGYTQKLQIKLLQNLVNDVSLKLRRTNDRLLHLM